MEQWIYNNGIAVAGVAVTIVLAMMGGIIELLRRLLKGIWTLAVEATSLRSSVVEATREAGELKGEISKASGEMKDEIRIIHGRIDQHETRLGHIEGRTGSWQGGET